jgi:glycosyltransferase involved in cell wall biosynthesis
VIRLIIPSPNLERAQTRNPFEWESFLKTMEWHPTFVDTPAYRSAIERFWQFGNSYANFTGAWMHLDFPDELVQLLKRIKFEFVLVNYAHHAAVLRRLGLAHSIPWIVETHDIQAYQYALQQKREVEPAEVEEEMQALAAFDHLVSISASEAKVFRQLGKGKTTWCLPFADARRRGEPLGTRFNLLIVGSDHDANVASIQWFIQSVYRPMLYKEGLTLAVVGKVCGKLDTQFLNDQITYCGRVENLSSYYEAADIVALPIISGAGVPIKVLDAFAHGKAFSLTRFPAAAIGLPKDFPMVDSAYEMSEDIIQLLDNTGARAARAARGIEFYRQAASWERYRKNWDGVLKAVRVPVPKTDASDDALPVSPLVDTPPIDAAPAALAEPTAIETDATDTDAALADAPAPPLGTHVIVACDNAMNQEGFHGTEKDQDGAPFRWMGLLPEAWVLVPEVEQPVEVRLNLHKVHLAACQKTTRVSINDGEWTLAEPDTRSGSLALLARPEVGRSAIPKIFLLRIDTGGTESPSLHGWPDQRQLSIAVQSIEITTRPRPAPESPTVEETTAAAPEAPESGDVAADMLKTAEPV